MTIERLFIEYAVLQFERGEKYENFSRDSMSKFLSKQSGIGMRAMWDIAAYAVYQLKPKWKSAEKMVAKSEWIKVADHLPDDYDGVLTTVKLPTGEEKVRGDIRCYRDDEDVIWFDGEGVQLYYDIDGEVTHWMPYPAPAED